MNEAVEQRGLFRSLSTIPGVPDAQTRALDRRLRLAEQHRAFRQAIHDYSRGLEGDSYSRMVNEPV